jgi:mycofactocin glycosyltransferase
MTDSRPPEPRSGSVAWPPGADQLAAVPAGMRMLPDPGTRFAAGGTVLAGGSPVRVLRLTQAGARQVAGWFAGAPVPASAGARGLARKLLDAGIAHPDFAARGGPHRGDNRLGAAVTRPEGGPAGEASAAGTLRCPLPADVTVVVPVRDRHAELDRCLAGLRDLPRVIVVDDASADPAAIKRIAAGHGAAVIHRPVNGGPGTARNTGLAAAETEFVAFLDSDCVPRPGWLEKLLPHFADPVTGAVAPRIVPHEKGAGWLARYEGASSTLDMGARPSVVRPGARVSYVPGAALVVRRAAAGAGFRDGMHVGEDVDFVWRTAAAGWRVRYEPSAVMGHHHRVTLRAWFARRTDYGTSAAALEELHPGAVRPLYVSWWTVGAWAAALSGRPVAAAALTATATALLARRLSRVTGEAWPVPVTSNSNKHKRGLSLDMTAGRWGRHGDPNGRPGGLVSAPSSRVKTRDTLRPSEGSKYPASSRAALRDPITAKRAKCSPLFPSGGAAWNLALRLAGGGTLSAARPLGSAVSRTWWPLAVPAAVAVRRLRLPVAALVLAPPLLDWADRRPPLDPVRYVAARLLDDAAYSLGVWQGCLARRTVRPLLPLIGAKRQSG